MIISQDPCTPRAKRSSDSFLVIFKQRRKRHGIVVLMHAIETSVNSWFRKVGLGVACNAIQVSCDPIERHYMGEMCDKTHGVRSFKSLGTELVKIEAKNAKPKLY